MATRFKPFLFLYVLFSLFNTSFAQSCTTHHFSNNKNFASCNDLPVLNSSIHWNYHPSSNKVEVAYRKAGIGDSRWIAWAINPTSTGMIGAQAIVAFQRSDGTMLAYTSPITSYGTQLAEGNLSFAASDISASYANNEMVVYATFELPFNTTSVHQVWQDGPLFGNIPGIHGTTGPNLRSFGNLDFLSGKIAAATGAGNARTRMRNIHGVLNAISWGTLMPLGAIIARYLKVFQVANPAWFYLHVSCQCSGYIVGVAGWATGLYLGTKSSGIHHNAHRDIGIAIFCLATLQVFALFLRPNKDHKYRFFWNIYHQSIGYVTIILSVLNVFKGLDILDPERNWKNAYIAVIGVLGSFAVLLEIFTWYVLLKRKSEKGEANACSCCWTKGGGVEMEKA